MANEIKTNNGDGREFAIADTLTSSPTKVPTSKAVADYVAANPPATGYSVYHAKIVGGDNNAPVIFINSTGADCTITKPANGQYTFTFASVVLTTNKTSVILTSHEAGRVVSGGTYTVNAVVTNTTVVNVYAGRITADPFAADNTAADFEILITIY